MYQFKTLLGDPVDEITQNQLDLLFEKCTDNDKRFYDHLIHINERQFENYNRELCSQCKSPDWEGSFGCCSHCTGYTWLGSEKLLIEPFNDRFNKKHGYFNVNKMQCSLPRHVRSHTCIGYSCSSDSKLREQFYSIAYAIMYMRNVAYIMRGYNIGGKDEFKYFAKHLVYFVKSGGVL